MPAKDAPSRLRLTAGIAVLAAVLAAAPTVAHAAGLVGVDAGSAVSAQLANVVVLSDAAMAQQTGTGLQSPASTSNSTTTSPPVRLWDEIKVAPPAVAAGNGSVTVTITTIPN